MIRFCYWLNESHFVIFQETFQLIRKAVQDLTYKKKLHVWFVCLLSLELDSGRVINIVTKNNFFSSFFFSFL